MGEGLGVSGTSVRMVPVCPYDPIPTSTVDRNPPRLPVIPYRQWSDDKSGSGTGVDVKEVEEESGLGETTEAQVVDPPPERTQCE